MRSRAGGKHPPLICFSKSVKHLILRCFRTNSKKALWRFHSAFLILRTILPVPARKRPLGRQPIPCLSQQLPGGRWKASLTSARAARPEGGEGDSQEEGEPLGSPPLVRSRRAGANFIHWGSRHVRTSSGEPSREGRAIRAPTGRDTAQAQIPPTWEAGTPVPRQRTIAGRARNARPCIFHQASVKYCCGSTFSSFTCTSKCRCGPVELPVLPESAICSPLATISPTATSSSELCAYSVL